MNERDVEISRMFEQLTVELGHREEAIQELYQRLETAEVISKVTVHRYICGTAGCGVLATVVKAGGLTLARTRDYKFSPGLNDQVSVPEARRKNTLDGRRHWPGHVFDVDALADWGSAGFDVNCRHGRHTVMATELKALVSDVRPGHPGKPTIL